MIKKISAFILSLTLAISCFASCGSNDKKDDSSSKSSSSASEKDSSDSSEAEIPDPSLTIDGKKIDTKDYVMCTIDGNKIDFDTFRYFYYYTLQNYTQYGITMDTIKGTEGGFENFLKEVIQTISNDYVSMKLCKEEGIELTDDDKKAIDENLKKFKSQFSSDEEYKKQLKQMYLTEDVVKTMFTHEQYYQKLFGEKGKYVTSLEDLKKAVQDPKQYTRVVHILIPYECQTEISDSSALETYNKGDLSSKLSAKKTAFSALSEADQNKAKESAKKLAEEVLQKAKNGEDFNELIKKYGWDPGMESQPDGYYVNQNTSFVEEFKTKAFELKENEISDLVENSSYGWFIIKRLPVDMDYVEKNYSTMVSEYDQTRFQKIFTDTVEKMKVENSKDFSKITADSIK